MDAINQTNADGSTPLINAAVNGDVTKVLHLLSSGADPLLTDNDGMTALERLEARGEFADPEVMLLLERAEAAKNHVPTRFGATDSSRLKNYTSPAGERRRQRRKTDTVELRAAIHNIQASQHTSSDEQKPEQSSSRTTVDMSDGLVSTDTATAASSNDFRPAENQPAKLSSVIVTDINIKFTRMVALSFKWALASIPAILLLGGLITGSVMLIQYFGWPG